MIANVLGGRHWVLAYACAGDGVHIKVNDPGHWTEQYAMSGINDWGMFKITPRNLLDDLDYRSMHQHFSGDERQPDFMINENKNERQPDLGKNREIFEQHHLSFVEAMRIVDEDYAKTYPTLLAE